MPRNFRTIQQGLLNINNVFKSKKISEKERPDELSKIYE